MNWDKILFFGTLVLACLLAFTMTLRADSITVFGPGLSYHAFIDPAERAQYPNPIADGLIWHPAEFGAVYKTKRWQTIGFYFKDSLGSNAGGLLFGPKWDLGEQFSLGLVGGAYVREKFPGNNVTLKTTVSGYDILFMPAVTASASVPVYKDFSLETNILSNGVVTHTTIGLRIDF